MNNTARVVVPFGTTWQDYPDAESLAVIVYFLGCNHGCTNCHNPLFQKSDYPSSKEFTIKEFYNEIFDFCNKQKTNKVVLSGGDCLHTNNIQFVREFVRSYGNIFNICIYTGDDVTEAKQKGLKGFTFIKTGSYKEELKQEPIKTDSYMQLASSNQEIYNINFSLKSRNGRMNFK